MAFKAHQGGEGQKQDRRGKKEARDEGGELKRKESKRGCRENEVAERTPGHRGRLFSALPGDECDRHANSGQHPCPPCPPQIQALGPAMASRATKLEPGQEAWGWVYRDPTAQLQPWLSSSILFWDPGGGGWEGGLEGLAREGSRRKGWALRSSPEEGPHSLRETER